MAPIDSKGDSNHPKLPPKSTITVTTSPPNNKSNEEYRESLRIRNARKRWEERKAANRGKVLLSIPPPQPREEIPDPVSMVVSLCSPTATVNTASMKKLGGEQNKDDVTRVVEKPREVLGVSDKKIDQSTNEANKVC